MSPEQELENIRQIVDPLGAWVGCPTIEAVEGLVAQHRKRGSCIRDMMAALGADAASEEPAQAAARVRKDRDDARAAAAAWVAKGPGLAAIQRAASAYCDATEAALLRCKRSDETLEAYVIRIYEGREGLICALRELALRVMGSDASQSFAMDFMEKANAAIKKAVE